MVNIDTLEKDLRFVDDVIYVEKTHNGTSVSDRLPAFGVMPGNILGAKLGVRDHDWGIVAPVEYRESINSVHLPIRNKGMHILDPMGNGKMVGLYENIIPGEVYVDWISLFMPRISTLDLYVSPSMFSMIKDVSKGKTDLMPHEHHMMTIWPRSWQGNNFLVTRGKIFETVGEGYVEIDGMLDGMELPLGLNDGIIHRDVKIKSMRRITSKMTIGAIHNNLVWNFTDDAVAYVPTISRPFAPTVMGQPFRHIENMPTSIEYVKEEYDEYVLAFSANKAMKLNLHSFMSHDFDYSHTENNTTLDRPWHAMKVSLKDSMISAKAYTGYQNKQDWFADISSLGLEDVSGEEFNFFGNNILKHFKKLNFGIIPVAHSQASRYRSKDTTLFKWNTDKPIKLKNFAYVPYNISDYSTYKTGSQNNIPTKKGVKSIYADNAEPSKFGFNEQDSFNTPDGGVIIDNSFMGIHEVRKLFPDDATVTIDKLIIPWLEESYEGNTLVKNMDVAIKPIKLKYENITNLSRLARVGDHELVDKYRTKSVKGLIMSSPLSYVINESSIGNLEDLKSKWNYQGGTMIFKRKGGATDLGRVGLDVSSYNSTETVRYNKTPYSSSGVITNKEETGLVFYSPYYIPQSYIDENKLKIRIGIISEETFKDEMHKGNGYYITDEKDDYVSLDPSGRDFLYPDTLDRHMFSNNPETPQRFSSRRNISMSNYLFDNSDNINYTKPADFSGNDNPNPYLNRCNIKRDYIQPEPTHKHTSELLKNGLWDFMRPNPTYDKLNLAYDMYEKNYSDYYNLAGNNMGGSGRQLISYPKNIMMLSFASDVPNNMYTLDTSCNDYKIYRGIHKVVYWDDSFLNGGYGPEYIIGRPFKEYFGIYGGSLTKITIKDPKLLDAYKKAGPDASIILISNVPLFLDKSTYIGGTFPVEEDYRELVDQVDGTETLTPDPNYELDLYYMNDTISSTYPLVKNCALIYLSRGFELDDAFLESSELFKYMSAFMQFMTHNGVLYRVNPHIIEPMYRKGMTSFFDDIKVDIRSEADMTQISTTMDTQHVDSSNVWSEYVYDEMWDVAPSVGSGFYRGVNVFPFINLRWCMQFAFDNMPKTITTIRGINLNDVMYVPDNIFPKQINKVIMRKDYNENVPNERESIYLAKTSAIWIHKPCENPNAVIEHNDVFKDMLVFTRDKSNDMFKEPLDEYYEWSIDGKVDGIQYNATVDKCNMYINSPTDTNVPYDMPFDMRVDELSDIYSKWTYADTSVNPEDEITVKWEIDLITKEKPDVGDFISHRFDLVYNGKAKDLINWNGFKFNSGTYKSKLDQLNTYYIGSPVVRNIRVYSDVYVCPAPNWERGIWGILRGTLPPGTDTRCVVIPQRCTEGIFYRNVDLSKGIVLGEYNGSLPEKLFWGTKKEKLNVSGIFTSTHNANPHSHRTRKLTYRGFRANEGDMVFDDKFPSLWLNQSDIDTVSQKYRASIMGADRHDLVDKRYGINLYKLNTASIIIDDENSSNLEKTKETGLRSNLNVEMWRITKRTEFGTIYIKSNDKSYILNTRPSVATVNDVSPLSIPHKFDEIDISNLGGFGDLHEVYSDDPFGITPYAYINHRPIGIYNRGYKAQLTFDSIKSITNYRAMILISLMRAIRSTVNIGSDVEHQEISETLYAENNSSNDTIYNHLERIGVGKSKVSFNTKVENFRYPVDNFVFDAADKRLRSLFLVGWSRVLKDSTLRASLQYILKHKNKLFASDDRCTDYIVNIFKEQVDRTPNNFEDLWLNFTGKNIYEERFRSTGDTTFPITSAIPVTSIFSKYTMLNGVAKTKNRNDYVFSEHRCGVLYDFYDRFVTSRFDQTEFDQSYYIIQSNIRRSNIYKVYHQGIDYKKGENYRYMSKGVFGYNAYENGLKMSDVINRLYGTNDRVRTPNIRSVYTHGGENCTNRYSISSMYYRSTLINETVGDIMEVGSAMPLVGPLYYNLYQTNQIPLNFIVTIDKQKDPSSIMNLTNTSQSVIKSTYNPQIKKNQLINLAMNRTFGIYNIFRKAYKSKTIRENEVTYTYYNKRKRAGVYKTIKEMFNMSPYILNGSIVNQYKIADIEGTSDGSLTFDNKFPYTKIHTSSIKLPEYYSNWSYGYIDATSGRLELDYERKGEKGRSFYPNHINDNLLRTFSYVTDRDIMKDKDLLNYYDVKILNFDNCYYMYLKNCINFSFTFRYQGIIGASSYAVDKDLPSSTPLNLKSYSCLLRSGNGRRFFYNNFIYPCSDNYLSSTLANKKKLNLEMPFRVDTNHHCILSNIHSINSQYGDLDEVCFFDDVSSTITVITFNEHLINMRGFKSSLNSPVSVSNMVTRIEVMAESSPEYYNYSQLYYTRNNKRLDIPLITSHDRSSDYIVQNYMSESGKTEYALCYVIKHADEYEYKYRHQDYGNHTVGGVGGAPIDSSDLPELNDSFVTLSKEPSYGFIYKHKHYISDSSSLIGILSMSSDKSLNIMKEATTYASHHASTISYINGRSLYRYRPHDYIPLLLSYVPCLNSILFDNLTLTPHVTLGRNRIGLLRSFGMQPVNKNTTKYNLGKFNVHAVIPNSLDATYKSASAWTNTDTATRNSKSDTHYIAVSGQFFGSHIKDVNAAAQMLHRTCGQAKGFPDTTDNKLPIKLDLNYMFSFSYIEPYGAKIQRGISKKIKDNPVLNMNFNTVVNNNYVDLYSLAFKFVQHRPINDNLDIWEAPNDRVGNGFSHINKFTYYINHLSVQQSFVSNTAATDNINQHTAFVEGKGEVSGDIVVFPKSPFYFSRPIYINEHTTYKTILDFTILNKNRTPKLYDKYDGSVYDVPANPAFMDINRLKGAYPTTDISLLSDPSKDM